MDDNNLKFDQNGLIPAVTVDAYSGEVLMQAYMNKEAFEYTLKNRRACYYSRSRSKLWVKGETSGNIQEVVSVDIDCDNDCVLLRVKQTGHACHTGNNSCFYTRLAEFEDIAGPAPLYGAIKTIKERKQKPQEGSYTNYLFDKGIDKICKKIGEEASEVIIAAKNASKEELANECADLLYHLAVLFEERGIDFDEALKVLKSRGHSPRPREYK